MRLTWNIEYFGAAMSFGKMEHKKVMRSMELFLSLCPSLAVASNVATAHARFLRGIEQGLMAIEKCSQTYDPYSEALARWASAYSQLSIGDIDGVRRRVTASISLAETLRDRFWLSVGFLINQ